MFLSKNVVRSNNRHKYYEAKHLKNGDMNKFRYHQRVRHAQEIGNELLSKRDKRKVFNQVTLSKNEKIPF
jgi:hypothetical protein